MRSATVSIRRAPISSSSVAPPTWSIAIHKSGPVSQRRKPVVR